MMHRIVLLAAALMAAVLLMPAAFLLAAPAADGTERAAAEDAQVGDSLSAETAPPSDNQGETGQTPAAAEETAQEDAAGAETEGTDAEEITAEEAPSEGQSVRLRMEDGTVQTLGLEEYLWGVVAAEMPAAFQEQALRAQAVAARTYALYRMDHPTDNHPEAELCCDSACCQAWMSREDRLAAWEEDERENYAAKLTAAVEDTSGEYITWEGEAILAAFHSSSDGRTRSAASVWGEDLPYLTAVDTPEGEGDAPNYYSVVTMTADEAAERLRAQYPEIVLEGDCADWFGPMIYDTDGLLTGVTVGGITLTAQEARAVFELRSASFTLSCEGESITFYVTGYGHGVGMSQYGANVMAKAGEGYREILAHYYPGTSLSAL